MMIDIEELLDLMHRTCGDSAYSKMECAVAYEEVASVAALYARQLRVADEAEAHGQLELEPQPGERQVETIDASILKTCGPW